MLSGYWLLTPALDKSSHRTFSSFQLLCLGLSVHIRTEQRKGAGQVCPISAVTNPGVLGWLPWSTPQPWPGWPWAASAGLDPQRSQPHRAVTPCLTGLHWQFPHQAFQERDSNEINCYQAGKHRNLREHQSDHSTGFAEGMLGCTFLGHPGMGKVHSGTSALPQTSLPV